MPDKEISKHYKDASIVLQENRQKLITGVLLKKPLDFMAHNTRLLDDYFREVFEKSMVGPIMGINKNPYAVIALGGYGRREQCVHSDVDILFLFKKDVPEKAEALIREMIYPLWDIGLDIGHATRSLKECVNLAGKDFEVLMSLLDARFICGMSPLYCEMLRQTRDKIIFRRSYKIMDWLSQSSEKRHQYFGDSAYLLEPNIKEGRGGLRDYHVMRWLANIKFNLQHPRDLEYQGHLSHDEFQSMMQALEFIWNTRNALHIVTGRKYDRLHFANQLVLARMFNYQEHNEQSAVEKFLSDLHGRMEIVKQTHLILLNEMKQPKKWFKIKKNNHNLLKNSHMEVKKERLDFISPEKILETPELLMQIFEESSRLKIPLSSEAKRLVGEFAFLINDRLKNSTYLVRIFEKILADSPSETIRIFEDMLGTGLLTKFIPEFQGIVNRIEYDAYHVFPVDRHLFHTVRVLKTFGTMEDVSDSLCRDLYGEIKSKKLLLWAGLLHDIGKAGDIGNHSLTGAETALKIMKHKGYGNKDADTVSFLVREHLLLINIVTRRNIEDHETLIFCSSKIQDINRLKMLYLLTTADLTATGPNAWNEWKAALLKDLFLNILRILEKGDCNAPASLEQIKEKTREILENESPGNRADMEALIHMMSPRYLFHTPAGDIREHIRLYKMMEDQNFIWKVEQNTESDSRSVTICGRNTPEYFSKIAGVFALNRINILEARTYTWRNHIALSIFQVTPPPDPIFENERWERSEKELHAALSGKLDITKAAAERIADDVRSQYPAWNLPHKIHVDNTASTFFTIIEVFTQDFPGLLFRLTNTIFQCRLDIWSAQISTNGDQVVDVFYVRDFDGQKVNSSSQISWIKTSIENVLNEQEKDFPGTYGKGNSAVSQAPVHKHQLNECRIESLAAGEY